MNTSEIWSLIFIFLIFLIPVLIAPYIAQSKHKTKSLLGLPPLFIYLMGVGLFIGYMWSFLAYRNDIFAFLPSRSNNVEEIILFVVPLLILIPVFHKVSKYLSMGFIMGVPTVVLFLALFAIELAIHPPDEE